MRVTVDIDDTEMLEDTLAKVKAIGIDFVVEKSTGGNHHVILSDLDMTFAESLFLRRYLHDDRKRNGLDFSFMLDPHKPKQILFNEKVRDGRVLTSEQVMLSV